MQKRIKKKTAGLRFVLKTVVFGALFIFLFLFIKRRIMSEIYKARDSVIEYFICKFDENKSITISSGTEIKENSFAHSSLSSINIKSKLTKIEKSAFENCNELLNFVCGEMRQDENTENINGINITKINTDFIIQKDAFENCSKLEIVILPQCKELIIEKDAFSGCESLRTVVALCDEIDFTGNPFADCHDYLTFICCKDSKVEKFARENGYRSIYV